MMGGTMSRRTFLEQTAAVTGAAMTGGRLAAQAAETTPAPDHTLRVISGKPRERGRRYGQAFQEPIRAFLDRELYGRFTKGEITRDRMLRYAGQCSREIRSYSPVIMEELEGIAEGSGLEVEELVLMNLHEEMGHAGALPSVPHCTAFAAGPPDTADGRAYVGQTWDWMQSVYGLSSMLLWKRPEGPDLLAYAYPGLWAGAGLNSRGIALCWTSAGSGDPRAGIPSYALLTQMLYQESLKEAAEEARRARPAGFFTFVLGDGEGRLLNVEGSPQEVAVEFGRGRMSRVGYGSRQMTRTPEQPIDLHPQCRRMADLLAGSKGKLDRAALQGFCGDHQSTICKHPGTLDAMLFDCTGREAWVARGPGCSGRWKRFTFEDRPPGRRG
jgi:isopenicillin-N N-acyltransferase like protein